MCDAHKISTVSFFPRQSPVSAVSAPVECSAPETAELPETADSAAISDCFEVTPSHGGARALGGDPEPLLVNAEAECPESSGPACILPKGRSYSDTLDAGRKALAQHIEQDLFGEGSDFPGRYDSVLKDDMLEDAATWTPESSMPFETFDPKEQAYETEVCGRPFTVTFTDGWKTARALMTNDQIGGESCPEVG